MLNVEEFLCQRKDLMTRYEQEARAYLRKLGRKADFVEQIPFLADGVADANIWCNADNNFRPLFITKEASIGFDSVIGLPEYYRKWDGSTYFEHVDDPFGDIKIGVNKFASNNPWQRIIKLARGLELLCKNKEFHEYSSLNYFGFETGGLRNTNNVSGDPVYEFQTANENYISTVNQIAVINIKKLAGGTNVGSELSVESGFYLDHMGINYERETLISGYYFEPFDGDGFLIDGCNPGAKLIYMDEGFDKESFYRIRKMLQMLAMSYRLVMI